MVNPAVGVEGDRTYLGRATACHGVVTEGGAIHSDRAGAVSSGRISRASEEGSNSKGAASRTQDSMSDKRQKNQLVLAFTEQGRSEAPKAAQEGTESLKAKCETERPAHHEQLMEEVCERRNCRQAYKRVKANKGSPGIDGRKVGDPSSYLKQYWPSLREQLLRGTYQPQTVRRVEIPKPDGGVRKLGIPTVLDRGAGQRVMTNVTRFLTRRLKLKVNEAKSAVARPEERKFLGFSFSSSQEPKRRIAPKVLLRCKQKIRELRQRTRGISLEQMMKELAAYLRGWNSYFGFYQTPSLLRALDEGIRRRLRSMIWKQWREAAVRAVASSGDHSGPRRTNDGQPTRPLASGEQSGPVSRASIAYFVSLGLPLLFDGDA